jgi:hypothetical protein
MRGKRLSAAKEARSLGRAACIAWIGHSPGSTSPALPSERVQIMRRREI